MVSDQVVSCLPCHLLAHPVVFVHVVDVQGLRPWEKQACLTSVNHIHLQGLWVS